MKRYLITTDVCDPFLTDWFDIENNFNLEINMVVYDLHLNKYYNGDYWLAIAEDHL